MRRREFIAGLGSTVVPLEVRAQLGDRARRIGMLLPYDQNDPVAKTRVSAFMQALAELAQLTQLAVDKRSFRRPPSQKSESVQRHAVGNPL
jgi:hypothetical protein